MASEVKANKLSPSSGTDLTLGDASDTVIVPTGVTLNVVDDLGVAYGGTGLSSFTAGDVLYATGTTTLAKLAKGTAEQVLAMNSGATAPDWGSVDLTVLPTITAVKGGTGQTSFTAGDIFYANSTTTITKLGKGTARQGLQTNSGATAPEWTNSPQSLMTAEGDILYASGANTLAKLAKGSDDEVLTLASGVPSWASAAGGAWNLLATTTASGDSEANFVHGSGGVDLTTYKMYKLLGMDLDVSDDDTNPIVLWSDDAGVSYETTNYETSELYITYGGAATVSSSTGASLYMNNMGNSAGETGTFEFTFPNPASSLWKNSFWCGVGSPATGNARFMFGSSVWKSTAAVDAFQFTISGGTFDGTLKLYGLS